MGKARRPLRSATESQNPHHCSRCAYSRNLGRRPDSAGRLVAPLVVMDLNAAPDLSPQISLDDIAAWESHHGMIPTRSHRRHPPNGRV